MERANNMDCCVLSAEEVGRLEHYNILPNHEDHHHVSCEEAVKGVQDDNFSIVTKNGRNYVTPVKMYFLKPVRSGGRGGIPVTQRVISNQLVHLKPIR